MARPKIPLIDRTTVVSTALEIIDRDGLDEFSIRKIAGELGVNGASLYHHFRDKDAILHGVRLLIVKESRLGKPPLPDEPWQVSLRRRTIGYREAILRHPNALPLMAPNILLRPFSLSLRDSIAEPLLAHGVPPELVLPIIDSVEGLVYASALLNPEQLGARSRLSLLPSDDVPSLARAITAAPRSAQAMFDVQLDALIEGWTALVARGS
jgi:TetR/AcrR family transcriptional regulator, tetracycline repressor protein